MIKLNSFHHVSARKKGDLLVVPFWKDKKKTQIATSEYTLEPSSKLAVDTEDFQAKEGEILLTYVKSDKEKRVALLGLGPKEKITPETLRRAYAALTKRANSLKLKTVNIIAPESLSLSAEDSLRGVVEGLLLANYSFTRNKAETIKEAPPSLIESFSFLGIQPKELSFIKKLASIMEGVYLVRDLTNGNADDITPQYLVEIAKKLAKTYPQVKATIFDKKRIEKEKLNLLLAVNRGSKTDPAFIILEYKGAAAPKEHTVIIGKGITYDTGGLNLKSSGMETMRCDMSGAAVALATLSIAAKLKLPIHLTAVIPATENSISATSYKPGDVYSSLLGTTVEIANTDAEGRLILADALAYANKHLKPTRMIDFATLTGGIDIALGPEMTGMMTNNDALAEMFLRAGQLTYERVWRLPLIEEYKDNLRSECADMKNVGTRTASSIVASIFLHHFAGDTPWVHFDIASTAFLSESRRYHPKNATGIGLRLMIEFLQV